MAPLAVKVAVSPTHKAVAVETTITVGTGVTLIGTDAEAEHAPFADVTVYAWLASGDAVTLVPVVDDNPVEGLQL